MKAFHKRWSLTLIPLVFGLMAWVGGAPVLKGQTGRIVFEHAPDGGDPWPTLDIYSVNADGTELGALTIDGHSHDPSWSPDGRHILYIHDTTWPSYLPAQHLRIDEKWISHAFSELYVMDSDGENAHLFRQLDARIQEAALSPDGKTLAFDGVEPGADGESVFGLFLIPVLGQGKPHRLFRVPSGPAGGVSLGPLPGAPTGRRWRLLCRLPKTFTMETGRLWLPMPMVHTKLKSRIRTTSRGLTPQPGRRTGGRLPSMPSLVGTVDNRSPSCTRTARTYAN
jgi:hypothetical protein